ncbi:TPA: YqaJ viral recombinase family protein [Pseudomonas aeruginosa]|uniref:YqaJ viral recombinase family protein n=1 Tax=Pseudomonas aeruginosa TaxID=287 RepID=UPI0035B5B3D9
MATHYTQRTGHRVRPINAVLQHSDPQLEWMLANIDREVIETTKYKSSTARPPALTALLCGRRACR